MGNDKKPANDAAAMAENAWKYRKSNLYQGKVIEGMIERIHAIEDQCPHLRIECYGEEQLEAEQTLLPQAVDTEPRLVIPPLVGQLALFSGDAAA